MDRRARAPERLDLVVVARERLPDALRECLETRLSMEGYGFEVEKTAGGEGFRIVIGKCPWHALMVKSGREHLSGRIGTLICNTEYSVWATEFGDNIRVELKDQICEGSDACILEFRGTP